ncbi:HD domain-containing protein [Desulfitobacterium sp.]|uniref:HD domain-containing protein n=1 Tax=Desulfitobacterium sp. TaxID=49981 RepID=UPI002D0FBDC7|nr:HD domain-containing protein [Desulfitobacterium sp.]HVJ49304.1 HD domain-containing protein [Desulfitobacterium sp.]
MKWEFINHMEEIYALLRDLEQEKLERDYPISWERVHATSCAQIGRLLAKKRGVDMELAALACSLHDIGRWYTGRQADHARHGEEPVRRFLEKNSLSAETKEEVIQAVIHHSEKEKVGSPLEEIVKDADILDCYLHGDEVKKSFHVARLENLLK